MKKFFTFIWAMFLSYLPGATSALFPVTGENGCWYDNLRHSSLTPNGIVFVVVWTVLYFLLGVALYRIIRAPRAMRRGRAYALFGVHMILNAGWTYAFFGLHLADVSLVICAVLLAVAIWMMRVFGRIDRVAGYLVWPYVIWTLFALYLNAVIVYLN